MSKDYSYIMDTAAVIGSKTPTMFSLYYTHAHIYSYMHVHRSSQVYSRYRCEKPLIERVIVR